MQVKRATRESHMGFSLTQLTCDIHHFHSVYIKQNESYACLTPGGRGGGARKGVEKWKFPCSQKGRTGYWWMLWRLHTAAYPRWTNQCLCKKTLFSQLLPKLVWQCFEVRREDTIISILPIINMHNVTQVLVSDLGLWLEAMDSWSSALSKAACSYH